MTTPPKCTVIYDPIFLKHNTGEGHPERPERLLAILSQVDRLGLTKWPTSPCNPSHILLSHTKEYLHYLEAVDQSLQENDQIIQLTTGDVNLSKDSLTAAKHAAGAGIQAVDTIFQTATSRVFCNIRPPGHHAWSNRGKGFCIFNNVAIAARYAQQTYAVSKVLIVDFDVHHGDGTQEIFYNDPSIAYFSTHQANHYPFTGLSTETGGHKNIRNIWNFPIAASLTSRSEVLKIYREELPQVAAQFQPDLILISCGFDGHKDDTLGGFNLFDEDYQTLTRQILSIAEKQTGGKLISFLEGGYHLDSLKSSSGTHLTSLAFD